MTNVINVRFVEKRFYLFVVFYTDLTQNNFNRFSQKKKNTNKTTPQKVLIGYLFK